MLITITITNSNSNSNIIIVLSLCKPGSWSFLPTLREVVIRASVGMPTSRLKAAFDCYY